MVVMTTALCLASWRLRALRAQGRAGRLLWAAVTTLGVAVVLKCASQFWEAHGWMTTGNSLGGVIAAGLVLMFCRAILGRSPLRRHRVTLWVSATALLLGPLASTLGLAGDAVRYSWLLHWTALCGYLAWSLVAATTTCRALHRSTSGSPTAGGRLRWESALIGTGASIGVGYTVAEFLSHVPERNDVLTAVSWALLALSVVLIALGVAGAPLHHRVDDQRRVRERHLALAVLRERWTALDGGGSTWRLGPPPEDLDRSTDPDELDFWVTRYRIEIADRESGASAPGTPTGHPIHRRSHGR